MVQGWGIFSQHDKVLLPVYNSMYSANIKPDERDLLFSAKMVYCLKLMNDLKHAFHDSYLRKVDRDCILISTVFQIAEKAASNMSTVNLKSSDAFINDLSIDDNGNLIFKVEGQELTLNHNHRTGRHASADGVLNNVKTELLDIQERVIKNITENIQDQCDKSSIYYLWSFLDFERKDELDCRKKNLRELLKIFCTSTVHEMEEEWNGYHITLEYPRLIDIDAEEIVNEFEKAWPIFNGLCLTYYDDHRNGKYVQLPLLQHFLKNNMIMFPGFCKLILILIASAANTSPLERSYSILEIVCAKRRSSMTPEHMELFYLLGVLKITLKSPFDYQKEVNFSRRNNGYDIHSSPLTFYAFLGVFILKHSFISFIWLHYSLAYHCYSYSTMYIKHQVCLFG